MTTDETKKIIDLYFDNELEKNRERILFTLLAEDEESREYFKQLNLIHSAITTKVEDFPQELEERIFNSISKNEIKSGEFLKRNFFVNAASLSIAALMLIISSFLFFEIKEYKTRVESVSEQIKLQNQTIELILNNSLPASEVHNRKVNEIIVNANL